jgi:ADP-ribosylation factor-like protein 2
MSRFKRSTAPTCWYPILINLSQQVNTPKNNNIVLVIVIVIIIVIIVNISSINTTNMGLLTILKKVKEEEREIRILILGLDNAGKTTIVKRLCGKPIDQIEPTLGFSIETLEYSTSTTPTIATNAIEDRRTDVNENVDVDVHDENDSVSNQKDHASSSISVAMPASPSSPSAQPAPYLLHLWDIGGQSTIRAYWRNYFERTDGLIWVVDSSDEYRLQLVQIELQQLLQQERLAGATLLVLANKQDVINAISVPTITNALELNQRIQYSNRHWSIYGCSAVTGQGLEGAMDWLVKDIESRMFLLD